MDREKVRMFGDVFLRFLVGQEGRRRQARRNAVNKYKHPQHNSIISFVHQLPFPSLSYTLARPIHHTPYTPLLFPGSRWVKWGGKKEGRERGREGSETTQAASPSLPPFSSLPYLSPISAKGYLASLSLCPLSPDALDVYSQGITDSPPSATTSGKSLKRSDIYFLVLFCLCILCTETIDHSLRYKISKTKGELTREVKS